MAPKAHTHRAGGGLTRTHSRGSSGGGSRLGLNNLQLTAKEPAPARYPDKQKKTHQLETNGHSRSTTHIARNSSSVRLQQKEHSAGPPLRRPSGTSSTKSGPKHKADFSIASPPEQDDDEWISSESGAATPNNESTSEVGVTPVEKPRFPPNAFVVTGFAKQDLPTPRAEIADLPRVDNAARQDEVAQLAKGVSDAHLTARDYVPQAPQPVESPRLHQTYTIPQQLDTQPLPATPPATKARSETHSPPRRSPDEFKRPMTRPPSINSIHSSSTHPLRPHPLIRANSIGYGAVLGSAKPVPLAPLTTVPAEPTSTEMSIQSSPTSMRTVSPTLSMHATAPSPVLSHPSPTVSEASRQLRRSSTSSRSSVATIPNGQQLQPSASYAQLTKASNNDRQRTTSTSSTFASLSSHLSRRPAPSPPKTPLQQMVIHFPPVEHNAQMESIHPLLPPPYLNAHLTMLAYRNPLAESYDRVMRAKNAR
ncbi:hypothetical protein BC835DRAFT_1285576 [Cytidiella melzeri]|nr:hypothetical protein BC835DRAFT_1285576 [Cytidiella melzeri]